MSFCKTIYSWTAPEVKQLITKLWENQPHHLYDNNYLGQQEGKEIEFINTWWDWVSPVVKVLPESYPYFYPTNGSSEAIRELIYQLKITNKVLHVFKNEYEGYKSFAQACDLKVVEHDRTQWKEIFLGQEDTFILSQPSSLDGNLWLEYDLFMTHLQSSSSEATVYLDLCYVGCVAREYNVNLNYPIIKAIFLSLSKSYGVYFHRIGGVLTKESVPGLYGNRWFKNMFSLELGIQLMKNFAVRQLPSKYKPVQELSISKFNMEHPTKVDPSDVLILAYSKDFNEQFSRGNQTRVCLTPNFNKEVK